jgi:hypothetical protein
MGLLGMDPDPWQAQVLEAGHRRLLLNCSRQAGKSTSVAVLSLLEALYNRGSLTLLLSRSLRQSTELFHRITEFHRRVKFILLEKRTAHELRLTSGSRIISLPCREDTIRGFASVNLLVIDEAARVPDDLYRAVRPMLAVSRGRLVCLSTPRGKHGFFYDAWAHGGADWVRIQVPATQVPRNSAETLAEERRCLGEATYRQEYECSFEALEGLVYPDFDRCVVASLPSHLGGEGSGVRGSGRPFGGIDFGFRNPFAAVWGVLDRDSVLWLIGEHYESQKPLSYHATRLPREVRWYADPSGASEIAELRCAGFIVNPGRNDLRPGIMAVNARLEDGTLRVLEGRCPHLLSEAGLYRYSTELSDRRGEVPVDAHNHALGALRYLLSRIDANRLARLRRRPAPAAEGPPETPPAEAKPRERPWLNYRNEELWRRIF